MGGRSCKSKLIIVWLLLWFFLVKSSIIVIAEEAMGTSCNDVEMQSAEENDKEAIEGAKVKWGDVIDICGSVFIEILGAFLGFLSAIALTNRSNKKQMKELDTSLLNELNIIFSELEERLKDNDIEDYFWYQIPIWEISLESGVLALVVNNKIYYKYIKVYSKIQYAQELETEYVHAKVNEEKDGRECFVNRYVKALDIERKKEAKEIYEYIKRMRLEENENGKSKIS